MCSIDYISWSLCDLFYFTILWYFYLLYFSCLFFFFFLFIFFFFFFFFFQAEDGIRDRDVTGVQTLCSSDLIHGHAAGDDCDASLERAGRDRGLRALRPQDPVSPPRGHRDRRRLDGLDARAADCRIRSGPKIGRASCRERV